MKNNLILNTIRSVKKAPGRFLAIVAIIAISCAFYSGVQSACPDMKNSGWKYYEEYSLADIHLKSTLGFNNDDAEKLLADDRFDRGYAGYSADLLIDGEYGQAAVKVMSYSEDYPLNELYMVEGRLPENPNECIADADADAKTSLKIGDTIVLRAESGEEVSDYVNQTEYTVVGLAMSPLYVSFERGATTIGNGSLDAFLYIPEENFAYETYTDIYLSVAAAHDEAVEPFSKEYEKIVAEAEEYAEQVSEEYLALRAEAITAEADEEIAEAREKLADGEKEYSDGKKDYDKGLKEYNDAVAELDSQRDELDKAEQDYNDGLKTVEESEVKLIHLSETCTRIDNFLAEYEKVYLKVLPAPLLNVFKEIQEAYDSNDVEAAIEDLMAVYVITDPEKDPYTREAARKAITDVNEQVRIASATAIKELAGQKQMLEESGKLIEENRSLLEEYEAELADAKRELDDGKKELEEAQAKIDDANTEISDAETELAELIADGKWYVWNRDEFNPGCMSYGDDAERVDSIAAVFPVFFIIIAALVCCTTMSRMVEEQRTETGTLKALGFSSFSIIMQYVLYASIASIIGSVIGTIIGFPLLPNIIYQCYQTMYNYPFFEAPYMPGFAAGCMIVSLLCTGLSAVYTSVKELAIVPALLIRPKPPKNGKRIFLEKIGFIWKNMKFTYKVTFRNLLRYKSRFLMTVIGIGGCTALLLTAFGLKEAIACTVDRQYDDIFLYDAMAVIGDSSEDSEIAEFIDVIDENDVITGYISVVQETKDVFSETSSLECYILAPDTVEGFGEYIVLRDRESGAPVSLSPDGAVITEKLAKMLGVGVGDTIMVEDGTFPVTVTAITENYTFHYVYLMRDTYDMLLGEKQSNMYFINTGNTPEQEVRDDISEQLISCDCVISASFMYDNADSFRKLVSSLDLIVIVLIVFAGALSFVILFNLANININERTRELATIKVLGFFDGEVGAYIYRENTISAVIGILCGLVLGIFFEKFVVKTAEVDAVMFSPDIPWFCFVNAALMMILFTVIVNACLCFKLKKIDMASSMKAIE